MQLSSLRSLPGSPFPTPLPSAPPPRRDVSAALPPQPPHHTPPQPRSHPSHPTAASLPNGCHSDRRGNPILWSSASPRLVSPTAALPKEPGDHGKDRVTTERSRQRPVMALGEAVAQRTWKGRESRGSHGKQAQTKQALTLSAAVTTRVPSTLPTFPPPPFIALSQFFVPQPHVLCFRAVHVCTVIVQTLYRRRICATCPQQALCSDFSSLPGQGQR